MMEKLNFIEFEDIEFVVFGLIFNNEVDRVSLIVVLRGVVLVGEIGVLFIVEFYINDILMQSDVVFLVMFDVG